MEQTTFNIRKCFEEMRNGLGDWAIILSVTQQEEIATQVENQQSRREKKAKREITALHEAIAKLKK